MENQTKFPLAGTVLIVLAVAGSVFGLTGRAKAAIYNTTPGESVASIQTAINNPVNDTINWTSGNYNQAQNQYYELVGDKNYTLEDGVTIRGLEPADGVIFKTIGSNINITGTGNVKLENSETIGIFGGDNFYQNINVQGITSETGGTLEASHYWWENRKDIQDVSAPSVYCSYMTLIGGGTGFHFRSLNEETNGTSPYISIDHLTIDGLRDIVIDIPVRDDIGELSDGQNYITNIALLNSGAVMHTILWPLFHTPDNLAQENVTDVYINEETNCFETNDIKFVSGTYIPQEDSPLNLGNGEYIGAHAPAPEPATLSLLVLGGLALIRRRRK